MEQSRETPPAVPSKADVKRALDALERRIAEAEAEEPVSKRGPVPEKPPTQ